MNLRSISLRNMRIRLLSSSLTAMSIALGTMLVASLWLLIDVASKRYRASIAGYSAVVGPKEASPLELTLNTVFHYGFSPNTIPFSAYQALRENPLRNKGKIVYAIPQCRGDNYKNFPIVGTTDEMFSKFRLGKTEDKKPILLTFAEGGPWKFGHDDFVAFAKKKAEEIKSGGSNGQPHVHEPGQPHHHHDNIPKAWRKVVIGATVARRLRLEIGDLMTPSHGLTHDALSHPHPEAQSAVVGILEATGGPIDRAIYIPLNVFLSMAEHDAIRPKLEKDLDNISLSAVIVGSASGPFGGNALRSELATSKVVQAAQPFAQISRLLAIIGNTTDVLHVVAWLVLIVTASTVLLGLYNTMNERRREIAIMRSLGARRSQIMTIILQEAVFISLAAAILGVILCHVAAFFLVDWIERKAGITPDWAAFSLKELWLILGVGFLGGLAGLLPAIKGSRVPVAENLGPIS